MVCMKHISYFLCCRYYSEMMAICTCLWEMEVLAVTLEAMRRTGKVHSIVYLSFGSFIYEAYIILHEG